MKPRIGRTIYTVYQDQISEDTVKFLGENSFIIANYEEYSDNYEFNYSDYNKVWFTSLAKAKAEMRKIFSTKKIKFRECRAIGNHIRFWEATE